MREIKEHQTNEANGTIELVAIDEPGDGGANHVYQAAWAGGTKFVQFHFQEGPIQKVGVNGITQEALIAVCIDRLRGFQAGKFACHENQKALNSLEAALGWLKSRTQDRKSRGVKGTHEL